MNPAYTTIGLVCSKPEYEAFVKANAKVGIVYVHLPAAHCLPGWSFTDVIVLSPNEMNFRQSQIFAAAKRRIK